MKKTMLTSISLVDAVNYIGGGESTVWYDKFAPIGFFENADTKQLIEAIRKVSAGERFVSAEIDRMLAANPPIPELTPRQFESLKV